MGAEYERKFRAEPADLQAIYAAFPGNWESIAMQTTYYDTPSGSLSAQRYMLRCRLENGIRVCTLKTPGDGHTRGEWEVGCDTIEDSIDVLCKLGCPNDLQALCSEGLVAICGARFIRRALTLTTEDCTAELALDEGILFSRDRQIPLCEMELELKEGSREALDAFAQQLSDAYRLQEEEKSKFARALALYQEE